MQKTYFMFTTFGPLSPIINMSVKSKRFLRLPWHEQSWANTKVLNYVIIYIFQYFLYVCLFFKTKFWQPGVVLWLFSTHLYLRIERVITNKIKSKLCRKTMEWKSSLRPVIEDPIMYISTVRYRSSDSGQSRRDIY